MRDAVATYGHDKIELEWRLGHKQGSFRPGVGADAWRRLQTALDASPAFTKTFKETVEKFGDAGGVKCIHDCVTGAESWLHKKRLADVDDDGTGPWSVRASVSLEEAADAPPQPVGQVKYERQKRRWSYRHACWSVDLTIVRSNLPSHLDEDRDAYEVEVELVDHDAMFERTMDNLVQWGWSLAADLCALMSGGAQPPVQPTPAPRSLWADM